MKFVFCNALIKPALGALAGAGLSFGAEKVLKKIFGKRFGPKEIELYKLAQRMTPAQKMEVERYPVGQGVVRGGAAQYGGFLGMLTSIGVPLAIDLVKKIRGKACKFNHHVHDAPPDPHLQREEECKCGHHLSSELGMIIKKIEFKDTPLSNIDLRKWCDILRIPFKGISSRNKPKPLFHSPCIINLDDFGNLGTHWVCCWCSKMARTSILIHLGFHHL